MTSADETSSRMRLYLFPVSTRVLAIVALKNHLGLDCDITPVDLGRGDQLSPEYRALNPNRKMPTLKDGNFVLWESNAILFYMAARFPQSGLWPTDLREQADVLRWLTWQSAHLECFAEIRRWYERLSGLPGWRDAVAAEDAAMAAWFAANRAKAGAINLPQTSAVGPRSTNTA